MKLILYKWGNSIVEKIEKEGDDIKTIQVKLTPEDKGVIYQRLNTDLGKALNVAKEIEAAKELIEQRHAEANKKNFETDPNAVKEKKKAK